MPAVLHPEEPEVSEDAGSLFDGFPPVLVLSAGQSRQASLCHGSARVHDGRTIVFFVVVGLHDHGPAETKGGRFVGCYSNLSFFG